VVRWACGSSAVAFSTLIVGFWGFWGSSENFRAGWCFTSLWKSFAPILGLRLGS
jgi:hypothetical protein